MAIKLISDFIPQQFAQHFAEHVLEGTLIKVTPGARGATITAGTNPTETSHACSLWIAKFKDRELQGTSIKTGDRLIKILADTIEGGVDPAPNDKIVLDGITYRIIGESDGGLGVTSSSVQAVFRCHARV